jgi:hypothetical protein
LRLWYSDFVHSTKLLIIFRSIKCFRKFVHLSAFNSIFATAHRNNLYKTGSDSTVVIFTSHS